MLVSITGEAFTGTTKQSLVGDLLNSPKIIPHLVAGIYRNFPKPIHRTTLQPSLLSHLRECSNPLPRQASRPKSFDSTNTCNALNSSTGVTHTPSIVFQTEALRNIVRRIWSSRKQAMEASNGQSTL